MKLRTVRIHRAILAGTYIYLALPVIIFCTGWCRWYVGIPAAVLVAVSCVLCLREYGDRPCKEKTLAQGTPAQGTAGQRSQWMKAAAVVILILLWVGLSGIGGCVCQTEDHPVRNGMFLLLAEQKWPLIKEVASESGMQGRGIVYYLGFWLPAAAAAKLFGTGVGWAVQYLWAAAGILLMYAHICVYRKKLSLWPLLAIIFFSGMDALGMLAANADTLQVFGDQHIEWWSFNFQFSSMTTQLFWVYNQAVPAWLASALVFLGERPKNIVFTVSLIMLTSTLPFLGMLPFVLYFMVSRSVWSSRHDSVRQLLAECLGNWGSLQNILGGGMAALVSAVYLSGNGVLRDSVQVLDSEKRVFIFAGLAVLLAAVFWTAAVLAMRGWGRRLWIMACAAGMAAAAWRICRLPFAQWQSPVYYWINLTVFYMVEAGALLYVLYPFVKDKKLFVLDAVCLYVIPLFMLKNSSDICTRASIPGLFLIMLWCIHAMDTGIRKKKPYRVYLLAALLVIGAVTPLHEMKRSIIRTREYYENTAVEEDHLYQGRFFSGSTEGFFWKHLAKKR